jgi:hypothetical protein
MKRCFLPALLAFSILPVNHYGAPPPDAAKAAVSADSIRAQIKDPAPGDACISSPDGDLIVVTSSYLAGGISGVFWKGKQYIDDEGHGGSLQYALVVDGIGSSYNPTEAGGKSDDYHFRHIGEDHITNVFLQKDDIIGPVWTTVKQDALTSSVLQKFAVTKNTIHSEVRPAFWLNIKTSQPDMWTDDNGAQHPAAPIAAGSPTSNYIFKKTVTIAPGGVANVIRLDATIIVPPIDDEIKKALANPATGVVGTTKQTSPSLTIDAPVGYLFKEFSRTYELVPGSGTEATLADISKTHGAPSKNDPYETHHPIIYATPDDLHALGVYSFPAAAGAAPVTYRTYVLGSAYSQNICEWEAAYHVPLGEKTETASYTTYLVLGTLPEVKAGLIALIKKYP